MTDTKTYLPSLVNSDSQTSLFFAGMPVGGLIVMFIAAVSEKDVYITTVAALVLIAADLGQYFVYWRKLQTLPLRLRPWSAFLSALTGLSALAYVLLGQPLFFKLSFGFLVLGALLIILQYGVFYKKLEQ